MLHRLFPILLLSLLAACATPEERAAAIQAEVGEMIQVYGPGCEKLGFAKNTDPWRECILRLSGRDIYRVRPTNTTCTGSQGFYNCTTY